MVQVSILICIIIGTYGLFLVSLGGFFRTTILAQCLAF